MKHRLACSLALAAAMLCSIAGQSQTITGYFGPVKGLVADPHLAGAATVLFAETINGSPTSTVCFLWINSTNGPNVGDPYIEVSTQQVNAALPCPPGVGCAKINPASSQNCADLVPGTCVQVSGHTEAPDDIFGRSWIVDTFSLPASCL